MGAGSCPRRRARLCRRRRDERFRSTPLPLPSARRDGAEWLLAASSLQSRARDRASRPMSRQRQSLQRSATAVPQATAAGWWCSAPRWRPGCLPLPYAQGSGSKIYYEFCGWFLRKHIFASPLPTAVAAARPPGKLQGGICQCWVAQGSPYLSRVCFRQARRDRLDARHVSHASRRRGEARPVDC